MTQIANAAAIAAPVNATATTAVNNLFGNVGLFNNKSELASVTSAIVDEVIAEAKPVAKTSAKKKAEEVENGPEFIATKNAVDALVGEYQRLKVEVFDRSDRALWQLQSEIYDLVLTINKSTAKKAIKKALIKAIEARKETISSSAETEVVVVRYIFKDVARQTRNNYAVVMQKAMAECIEAGGLFAFLEEHKGIVNVVEHNFDSASTETAAEAKEAKKAERKESGELAKRLFTAMSNAGAKAPVTTHQVADFNVSAEEVAKLKEADKALAKNQRGKFVFFVALPSDTDGTYNVVQGFSAPRDFEDALMVQIAARLGAGNEELAASVAELENASANAKKATQQKAVFA